MVAVDEKRDVEAAPAPAVPHFTPSERAARGRSARAECPRSSHADFELADDRDPVAILEAQATTRVPELVPVRYGRMLASPFTFYRGAAAVMAHDLARDARARASTRSSAATPTSRTSAASPRPSARSSSTSTTSTRRCPGPFEWDLKRLAASFEIAARDRELLGGRARRGRAQHGRARTASGCASSPQARNLDVWYARLDVDDDRASLREQQATAARRKRSRRPPTKARTQGQPQGVREADARSSTASRASSRDPPLIVPAGTWPPEASIRSSGSRPCIHELFREYRETLQPTAGTCSRSTDSSTSPARSSASAASARAAGSSCCSAATTTTRSSCRSRRRRRRCSSRTSARAGTQNHGQRVVEGQRLMQATSDILLGWVHVEGRSTARERDFYVRQLWDWKTSADVDDDPARGLELYGRGVRLHPRTGACPLGRPDRDRRPTSGKGDDVRPGARRVRGRLRRPERARPRRAADGRRRGPHPGTGRALAGVNVVV